MVASGRLNRMTNGSTSEPEHQDHHDVDGQDGHAHREEQAAEGLVLLGRGAGERDVDAGGDVAGSPAAPSMSCWASTETAPWSSLVMSPEIVAAGEPSTRVTEPCTSTWSTSAS